MATLYKILILCVGFALSTNLWAQSQGDSMQTDTSPLKIERDALGAVYYWIDNNALELDRIDYSDLYETYMTPIEWQLFEDCTQLFIEGKLRLEPNTTKTRSDFFLLLIYSTFVEKYKFDIIKAKYKR